MQKRMTKLNTQMIPNLYVATIILKEDSKNAFLHALQR